jgi:hypothetical protein
MTKRLPENLRGALHRRRSVRNVRPSTSRAGNPDDPGYGLTAELRGDQLHCPAFDSLSGQILTGQESRGEISKTRLTLLLTVLKTEGGRQGRAGNGIEAPSFCKVIVAITRSFGRSGQSRAM